MAWAVHLVSAPAGLLPKFDPVSAMMWPGAVHLLSAPAELLPKFDTVRAILNWTFRSLLIGSELY